MTKCLATSGIITEEPGDFLLASSWQLHLGRQLALLAAKGLWPAVLLFCGGGVPAVFLFLLLVFVESSVEARATSGSDDLRAASPDITHSLLQTEKVKHQALAESSAWLLRCQSSLFVSFWQPGTGQRPLRASILPDSSAKSSCLPQGWGPCGWASGAGSAGSTPCGTTDWRQSLKIIKMGTEKIAITINSEQQWWWLPASYVFIQSGQSTFIYNLWLHKCETVYVCSLQLLRAVAADRNAKLLSFLVYNN